MGRGEEKPDVKAHRTGRICRFAVVILAVLAMLACSNSPQPNSGENRPPNTGANVTITPPSGHPPPEVALNGNLAERTNQKRKIDLPAAGAPPPGRSFDAPEDSAITTAMNSQGQILEIREFKSHPQLARLELTWTGPKEKILKIFLRDGGTREVSGSEIPNLRSVTGAQILELAGV